MYWGHIHGGNWLRLVQNCHVSSRVCLIKLGKKHTNRFFELFVIYYNLSLINICLGSDWVVEACVKVISGGEGEGFIFFQGLFHLLSELFFSSYFGSICETSKVVFCFLIFRWSRQRRFHTDIMLRIPCSPNTLKRRPWNPRLINLIQKRIWRPLRSLSLLLHQELYRQNSLVSRSWRKLRSRGLGHLPPVHLVRLEQNTLIILRGLKTIIKMILHPGRIDASTHVLDLVSIFLPSLDRLAGVVIQVLGHLPFCLGDYSWRSLGKIIETRLFRYANFWCFLLYLLKSF